VKNKDPENYDKDEDKISERLNHLNTIGDSKIIHNLLMISGCDENNNNKIHVMYIKDVQKYSKLHICPKCRYIPPATHGGYYHKDRFEKHIKNYKKISRSIYLNKQSIPFIPHIQKNPIFAYLLAHNRKKQYRVIQEYITYDFETVMKKETHKISDKTFSYTQQLPLSVAYHINNNDSKTSKFLYRGENTCEEFINNWLNSLFTDAQRIFNFQNLYYDSLNIPQYILSKMGFNDNNKYNISIKVIGFNSKKFDVNIFLNYISDP
jgi:hypothetical protein